MKNDHNVVSQKITMLKPKDMEFWYLNDKKFKIAVLKEFSEQPENSESHYNGLRIEINKQEYFTKEIDILKKKQREILWLKNSGKMKYALQCMWRRAEHIKEAISKLEGRSKEMTPVEKERKLRF